MNKEILHDQWKLVEDQVQRRWGLLTEDDVTRVSGQYEALIGLIRDRYSVTKEKATDEVNEFINSIKDSNKNKRVDGWN